MMLLVRLIGMENESGALLLNNLHNNNSRLIFTVIIYFKNSLLSRKDSAAVLTKIGFHQGETIIYIDAKPAKEVA